MSRRPKFVVHQGKDGQHYVRLVSANGRILMSSEGYTRLRDAGRAVDTVIDTLDLILHRTPHERVAK